MNHLNEYFEYRDTDSYGFVLLFEAVSFEGAAELMGVTVHLFTHV